MSVIIFDFDGTIVDSRDYFIKFIAGEAKKLPLSKEDEEKLLGLPLAAVARTLGIPWWRLPRLYFNGRKRMDAVIRQLKPFDDMEEVIRKLHAEGHELFIISSNSVRNIRIFLKRYNLREYFVEIYGGIEVFGKASMFHQLFRENNIKAKQVIGVGDETRDLEAANSVGIRTIAVTWGFARLKDLEKLKPTAIAYEPNDILKILEEL
jgi:phosphoglycolate phosphatase-like HAD superfamily hydrolase